MTKTASEWGPAPAEPRAPGGEVHLWLASLEVGAAALADLRALLDPDERARATRFLRARDRRRFEAARGTLRRLLARYGGREAAALRFGYGPRGKPFLEPEGSVEPLRFNLSHAGDRAVIAVAGDGEVGVDLERVRPGVDAEDLAGRFFTAGEQRLVASAPPEGRADAFFRIWTRKEAVLKAGGEGFARSLAAVDVTGEEASVVAGEVAERWRLRDLPLAAGCRGAVATVGVPVAYRFWRWPPVRLPGAPGSGGSSAPRSTRTRR